MAASGVSIDDFGASFIHYLPGVIMTLNTTSRARLLPQGEIKWEGTNLEKKVHVRRNVAITFTEDGGPIPPAGKQSYVAAKAYRKFCTGSVRVTDGILDNAKTTRNAAITVVESELRGMLDSIRKLENYLFTRDGTGVITLLGSTTSGATITVDDARSLWEGADFTILDTDGTTQHATFVVSKIARAFTTAGEATVTPTASIAVAAGVQADGDYIVWGSGSKFMYNRAPTGLDALVSDGTGTFQSVDVTTYNRYTSPVFSNATDRPLTTSLLRQAMATVISESGQEVGSELTLLGNIWEGVNFEEMFESEVRLTESSKVGGVEIASFQSTMGKVNIVTDPDAPYGKLFLVDMSQISRAVQHELDWRRNGNSPGAIFNRDDNALCHRATCLETYEYFIEQRNRCAKITNIKETRGTALG